MPTLIIASPERIRTLTFSAPSSEALRRALFTCLCVTRHAERLAGDALLGALQRPDPPLEFLRRAAELVRLTGTFALHVQCGEAQPVQLEQYLRGETEESGSACPACGEPGAPHSGSPCPNCHGERSETYCLAAFLETSGTVQGSRAFAVYMDPLEDEGSQLQEIVDRARLSGVAVPEEVLDVQGFLAAGEREAQVRRLIEWLRRAPGRGSAP